MSTNFKEEFLRAWSESVKGLIQPSIASSLMGIKRQAVNTMINRDELKSYKIGDKTFLSLQEIIFWIAKRDAKKSKTQKNEK